MNRVELLSPAGDYECFISAVSAGCDAVYLSGEKYGARAYAKNFTNDEVIRAIETAHLYGKKVYLTVNTLLKNDEINGLYDYLCPFYEAGLDSVIVQDIGVISYITKYFPKLSVHLSTQLAITSTEGIKLLSKLNVKRTVLARELSLAEIKEIHKNDAMELECFIHGALCYSYSGKCLFSSLIGGRSGNRGRCAGSCRQPYNDKYVLSTKDICCLEILPELISAGITSYKIEGRMKSPEYVYGVTSMYRKYIDIIYDNIPADILSGNSGDEALALAADEVKCKYFSGKSFKEDLSTLERLYTRGGNSQGYYFKYNGRDMITLEDASYKRDSEVSGNTPVPPLNKLKITGRVSVKTNECLKLELKYNDYDAIVYGGIVEKAGNRPIDESTVRKQMLKTGDTVFEFEYIEYSLSSDAFVRIGELNELRRDGLNALKNEILNNTRRTIREKEAYVCTDKYIGNGKGVGNGKNIENVRDIEDSYNIENFRYIENCKDIENDNGIANNNDISRCKTEPKLCVDVCTKEQLEVCLEYDGIDRIYVPYNFFAGAGTSADSLFEKIRGSAGFTGALDSDGSVSSVSSVGAVDSVSLPREVYIKFPSVVRNGFIEKNAAEILNILLKADGVLIDNNELLYFLKENAYDKPISADIHMYCLNNEACNTYRELGISRFTVPAELNKRELYERNCSNEELIIYGYLPMMVSAQCVNNTLNGCDKGSKHIELTDRRGTKFVCVNDCDTCMNTIYNSVPVSLHDELELIEALNPECLKICLTTENAERSRSVIDFFKNEIGKHLSYKSGRKADVTDGFINIKSEPPYKYFTKGHINRGVL